VPSRSLLEAFTGVAVFAARPPIAAALFASRLRRALRGLRLLRRFPQPSAREPLHHDIGVLPLQLVKRRQELFALARAKGRGHLIDEDGPVRVARGHSLYCCITPLEPSEIALVRNHLARENVDVERDGLEARLADFDVMAAGRQR